MLTFFIFIEAQYDNDKNNEWLQESNIQRGKKDTLVHHHYLNFYIIK